MRITKSHRDKQIAYNTEHGIVPKSVKRKINESAYVFKSSKVQEFKGSHPLPSTLVAELTKEMLEAADNLEFERAAYLRDQIKSAQDERHHVLICAL